jgi:hypothetical protein
VQKYGKMLLLLSAATLISNVAFATPPGGSTSTGTTYTYNSAACSVSPTTPKDKKCHCNNGWGNGGDCTNPGSPHGNEEQKGTKTESKDR